MLCHRFVFHGVLNPAAYAASLALNDEQGAQFKCVFDVAQQLIPFEGDQFVAESAKIVQKNARAG